MHSSDVTTLRAALIHAEAEAARTKAINADLAARVALLELQNEKMRRALYGQRVNDTVKIPTCGKVNFPTFAIVGFRFVVAWRLLFWVVGRDALAFPALAARGLRWNGHARARGRRGGAGGSSSRRSG